MKRYLHAFGMCQSMFCAIPSPYHGWDEDARPLMLLFLPLVGLEMGLIWAASGWLCRLLDLNNLITGLVLCAVPYLLSGFIHLDGFLDVTDAVGSCRSLEKRREILKDSHVGAFAVIGCCLLMIASFAFCAAAEGSCGILVLIPAASRCCSALAVTVLRPMSTSQYSGSFREGLRRGQAVILTLMLAVVIVCGFVLFGKLGFVLLGELFAYALALRKGFTSLDGMNGDISGYALTLAELAAMAAWAVLSVGVHSA